MVQITNEYSNFPSRVLEKHNFKDVDNIAAPLVNQVKNLQSQGKYNEAAAIINQNAALLKQYIIDTPLINKLIEEIRNAQIYAVQQKQSVFISDTEPLSCVNDDIWIGGGAA